MVPVGALVRRSPTAAVGSRSRRSTRRRLAAAVEAVARTAAPRDDGEGVVMVVVVESGCLVSTILP